VLTSKVSKLGAYSVDQGANAHVQNLKARTRRPSGGSLPAVNSSLNGSSVKVRLMEDEYLANAMSAASKILGR
jgi:hypothetical protein